jgi:type I restriction enzyme S subunit
VKNGWQTKPLGEILQKTETVNPLDSPETEFNYIDVSSVSNVTFQIEETQRLKGRDAPSRARRLVKANDVLFATVRPTLRRIAVVPEHLDNQVCSTGYFVLRPKTGISHRFVFYALFTEDFMGQMESFQKGASYPAVTDGEVRSQVIPVPPLPEQERIVGVLDEAFDDIATAKANAEKNLQNPRDIFQSYLQSVFTQRGPGWVERRLTDVCEKITDGTHQTPTYHDKGVIFLSSRNVTSGKINWDDIKYIDHKQHVEMHKRVAPRPNDILLAKNGTTGVAAIVDRDVTFDIYVSLALLRAKNEILPQLLLYFINSPVAKHQFNKRLKGIGVPNLHLEEIREVVISFPNSLTEQKAIATKLDDLLEETQRLEFIYKQKLAALDALKKSLLHQAFTGELSKPSEQFLQEALP